MLELNVIKGVVRETVSRLNTIHVLSASVTCAENTAQLIGHIPWKRWKVIGYGVLMDTSDLSDLAHDFQWGYLAGDLGAADPDAFGKWIMTTGHVYVVGDMIYRGDLRACAAADAPADADSIGTWTDGVKFNVWQTKQAYVNITHANVGTGDGLAFVVIEVDNAVQLEG